MKPDESRCLDYGVWFQSAVSRLWYTNQYDAGAVSCVAVDGKHFYPLTKPENKENDE